MMWGRKNPQTHLFYSIDVESRIRPDPPLQAWKQRTDVLFVSLALMFAPSYSQTGRPSPLVPLGQVPNENRNDLISEVRITGTNGTAVEDAAIQTWDNSHTNHGRGLKTVSADSG